MPSTYAHYKFGTLVQKKLPKSLQSKVQSYQTLYEIGQHGPDILFYYHPFFSNRVNRIGFGMHKKQARPFFQKNLSLIHTSEQLSYMIGFICHYVLDSQCHDYINAYITSSGISHTEIEAEFDRLLMINDSLNPITHRLTNQIIPTYHNACIISTFFPELSALDIQESLKGMIWYNDLILAPSKYKRFLVYGLLKLTKHYDDMQGLIINYEPNPKCNESNAILTKRLYNCIPLAVELIKEYHLALQKHSPLSSRFCDTYSGIHSFSCIDK